MCPTVGTGWTSAKIQSNVADTALAARCLCIFKKCIQN